MLQNLPSIVAAQAMRPQPGWRILDMCAAPGGKTTTIAELMNDEGEIIALDRTNKKAADIQSLAAELGLSCITVYKGDATKALLKDEISTREAQEGSRKKADARAARRAATRLRCKQEAPLEAASVAKCPGFEAESFDGVLLDAPCSALGLRPRLDFPHTWAELDQTAQYQRRLLDAAVQFVKPGGTLLYSTCTINPSNTPSVAPPTELPLDENEANVRYVLDRYPLFNLEGQQPYIGEPGLVGEGLLSAVEGPLVQRFYPDGAQDSIGFFIARFLKQTKPRSS